MGRKRTVNTDLPPRVRRRTKAKGKAYYYYDTGATPRKEIPLGNDYPLMLKKWAELHIKQDAAARSITFRDAVIRYEREVIPMKSSGTQNANRVNMKPLLEFFGNPPAPLDEIRPVHIRQYLDSRRSTPVSANKEKALFSHVWNMAMSWGYTDKANPCVGIRGFKEKGRDRYVEDAEFAANYALADAPVRDAMDLAYLTSQRPADVLKMMETDIKDGELWVTQNKTGKKQRIAIIGQLAEVIDRIMARKAAHQVRSLYLVCNEYGGRLTYPAWVARWKKLRIASGVDFQFRDLRAKAATDKDESEGGNKAQKLLGHESQSMTKSYIRNRKGDKVDPTK